jgi:hypothetical protein
MFTGDCKHMKAARRVIGGPYKKPLRPCLICRILGTYE